MERHRERECENERVGSGGARVKEESSTEGSGASTVSDLIEVSEEGVEGGGGGGGIRRGRRRGGLWRKAGGWAGGEGESESWGG